MTTSAFTTILVPLDGSATAEQTLSLASAIARRSRALLHLATVHMPLPILLPSTEAPMVNGELERELQAEQATYLTSTATAVGTAHGIEVTGAVLDLDGTVARALGTHAARGVERLLLGSVADKVIRGATQVVLVVPTHVEHP